jgi:CBS domain-containing protein
MEIEGITLWLFGGVAKFRGMFPSAGAEFRIAVAGPLVSLLLGAIFVLAAWRLDLPDVVDGIAAWLGYINLVLLVFNLLPALPLDGGRVLRAILWHLRRNFAWATVVAANIGRAFGFLMIGGGLLLLILLSALSGVWLALIGLFLLQAAGSELRFLGARQALGGLRVRDLMVRDPVTVRSDLTVGELMHELVRSPRHTTYPVVDDGRAVGLLPFARVAVVPRAEWDARRVRDYMLPRDRLPVVDEDEELITALQQLSEAELQRALVLDGDDRLAGFLSISDLVRVLGVRGGRLRRARTPV